MLAKVRSCAIIGLEGAIVEVEVDLSNALAAFMIVGLPDTAVNKARDRVRAAIKMTGALSPSAAAPDLFPRQGARFGFAAHHVRVALGTGLTQRAIASTVR